MSFSTLVYDAANEIVSNLCIIDPRYLLREAMVDDVAQELTTVFEEYSYIPTDLLEIQPNRNHQDIHHDVLHYLVDALSGGECHIRISNILMGMSAHTDFDDDIQEIIRRHNGLDIRVCDAINQAIATVTFLCDAF